MRVLPSSLSFPVHCFGMNPVRAKLLGAPCFRPQAKASPKRVAIVANSTFWRQLFQFLRVATSQHNFVRFESGDQPLDDIRNVAAPLLLAFFHERLVSDIALIGSVPIREMT